MSTLVSNQTLPQGQFFHKAERKPQSEFPYEGWGICDPQNMKAKNFKVAGRGEAERGKVRVKTWPGEDFEGETCLLMETVAVVLRDVWYKGSQCPQRPCWSAGVRAYEIFLRAQGDAEFHTQIGTGKNPSPHVWDTKPECEGDMIFWVDIYIAISISIIYLFFAKTWSHVIYTTFILFPLGDTF